MICFTNILDSNLLDCNQFCLHAVSLNTEYTKIFIGLHRIFHIDTSAKYEGWKFISGNYLFTTDTK